MERRLYSSEHDTFRTAFREFIARHVVPHQARWREQGQVDREVWKQAGANGFLLKRSRPSEIVHAVRLVISGESLLFPVALRALANEYGNKAARQAMARALLTEREAAILRLMARGMSNADIAGQLVIGGETVKSHVSSILGKLGARDRTQAVIAAYESGFVTPADT